MELNTLIRIQCYKQATPPGLKKNKRPCSDSLNLQDRVRPKGVKFRTPDLRDFDLRPKYKLIAGFYPVGVIANRQAIYYLCCLFVRACLVTRNGVKVNGYAAGNFPPLVGGQRRIQYG